MGNAHPSSHSSRADHTTGMKERADFSIKPDDIEISAEQDKKAEEVETSINAQLQTNKGRAFYCFRTLKQLDEPMVILLNQYQQDGWHVVVKRVPVERAALKHLHAHISHPLLAPIRVLRGSEGGPGSCPECDE